MKILTSTPLKYNQYQTKKTNNKQQQSFGMNPTKIASSAGNFVTDGMAYGFGWLASTKPVQGLVNFLKDTNYQRHISAFVGVVLSSYYMIDTAKSKRIEKEQKMPLIVNQGTVSVLSTLGAYSLDGWLDKILDKTVDTVHVANITHPKYRAAMVEYHADKENYQAMQKAVDVLKVSVETPKQLLAANLAEIVENEEQFNAAKKALKNNELAKELFQEISKSENPKAMLNEFATNKDLFAPAIKDDNVLRSKFQLKNKDIKKLKSLVKKDKADEAVKELLEGVASLSAEKKNKSEKIAKIFLEKMENSAVLKKMYSKASFQNAIDLVSSTDEQLSKRMKGFRFAKSIMVFAMIYRFVAPVIATPIANSCSDKIEAYKKEHNSVNKVA